VSRADKTKRLVKDDYGFRVTVATDLLNQNVPA
jgi:hypothetical protein